MLALRSSLAEGDNTPGWVSTPPILVGGSGDNLPRMAGELTRGEASEQLSLEIARRALEPATARQVCTLQGAAHRSRPG